MNKVLVTGISIYSCLGDTQATWQSICLKKSGVRKSQPFPLFPPLPLGMINHQPSSIPELTFKLIKNLCCDSQLEAPAPEIGIVIGSSRGCQNQWEKYLQESQNLSFSLPWLETLPFQPAIICSRYLKTSAMVLSPANACATGLVSIAQGYELIKRQQCTQVVVGAVETPITPLTIAGFSNMKALSSLHCDPFGQDRDGFVLAEGGAMLLLETEISALNRGAKIYGEIAGWGLNCDAEAMSAPEPEGHTAMKAIVKCLTMAQLNPLDIDYIHAHGTGTILNDQREAKIIQTIFPHAPLISSTKAFTGHTLGASGAIASALTCLSLHQQTSISHLAYSPCNYDLNLCQESRNYSLHNSLCFSFGFGGQNAMIAIKKYPQ